MLNALKDKVSWKVTSTKDFPALHVEAYYGLIEFVREMLTKVPAIVCSKPPDSGGADASNNDTGSEDGYTPLHLASQSGYEGLVCILLNSPGVPADTPSIINGSMPLHLAAQDGHTAVVSLLSKSTNQLLIKGKRSHTGTHLAASNGHHDILLGKGADIDVYYKRRLDMPFNV